MFSASHVVLFTVTVLSIVSYSLQFQRSTANSPSYVAAVVEYSPIVFGDGNETFHENVQEYVNIINMAAAPPDNADIIAFPEAGLVSLVRRFYSQIPEPLDKIIPCDDKSGLYMNLQQISCAAKKNHIYVVINLSEVFPCKNGTLSNYNQSCPESEAFHYNTNVAFDRNGAVIARYRKFHLFGEYEMDKPPIPELSTFYTDFGVTFGMFTCFDINFEKPAVQLIREKNITDVIFLTAWFSEIPFLTAVQTQAAWSNGMDVNFLASGYSAPDAGCGGSGIFAGRDGPLATIMPTTASTHLLVRTVPKKSYRLQTSWDADPAPQTLATPLVEPNTYSGLKLMRENLTFYKSQLLDPDTLQANDVRVCKEDFCCNFTVSAKKSDDNPEALSYFYHMAVFNGSRTFSGYANASIQVCAVISCTNVSLSSCNEEFNYTETVVPVIFKILNIKGFFKIGSSVQLANTLIDGYHALPGRDFSMTHVKREDNPDISECMMVLERESTLRTFGIFELDFSSDHESPATGGCRKRVLQDTLCVFLFVKVMLFSLY